MIVRLMFGAVGFHRVRTVGEQATRQQAPVLAVAPHSSFYDGIAAIVADGPIIVAKEENSFIPVIGSTGTIRYLTRFLIVTNMLQILKYRPLFLLIYYNDTIYNNMLYFACEYFSVIIYIRMFVVCIHI